MYNCGFINDFIDQVIGHCYPFHIASFFFLPLF